MDQQSSTSTDLLFEVKNGIGWATFLFMIVALAFVYRDNRTPQVSLDPDPALPAGPQVSRVLGIPPDSSFARVLLDADYAMKRILAADEFARWKEVVVVA